MHIHTLSCIYFNIMDIFIFTCIVILPILLLRQYYRKSNDSNLNKCWKNLRQATSAVDLLYEIIFKSKFCCLLSGNCFQ